MKTQVTKKSIRDRFDVVVCLPYCAIQTVLRCVDTVYYCAGYEGWHCDVYTDFIDGKSVAITTGYQPFGSIKPPYDFYHRFEKTALFVVKEYDHETANETLKKLYQAFVSEVCKF